MSICVEEHSDETWIADYIYSCHFNCILLFWIRCIRQIWRYAGQYISDSNGNHDRTGYFYGESKPLQHSRLDSGSSCASGSGFNSLFSAGSELFQTP
ncbi:hypothetical protein D3C78_656240 [compost metagenome]